MNRNISRSFLQGALPSAVLVAACIACGSSDPVSSAPPGEPHTVQFEFILGVDVVNYVDAVRGTIPTLNLVRDEFATISEGWVTDRLTPYWARQFGANLMQRADQLRVKVAAIRPASKHLREIHLEYEAAVAAYTDAFKMFLDQMETTTSQSIENVNREVYRGNYLMDQFQLRLNDLAGTQLDL